jgi:hypothetical protein
MVVVIVASGRRHCRYLDLGRIGNLESQTVMTLQEFSDGDASN